MSKLNKKTVTAIRIEIATIINTFNRTPKPQECFDCDDMDLYQKNIDYRIWKEEQQNALNQYLERLNEPKIYL